MKDEKTNDFDINNSLFADINSLQQFFIAADKVKDECTNWGKEMFEHFNVIK